MKTCTVVLLTKLGQDWDCISQLKYDVPRITILMPLSASDRCFIKTEEQPYQLSVEVRLAQNLSLTVASNG